MATSCSRFPVAITWAVVASLLAVGPMASQPSGPKPPLKGDETTAQRLAELSARADRLLEEGKFAEAIDPALAAVKLAAEVHGPNSGRASEADWRLQLARTGKDLPEDRRLQLAKEIQAVTRARKDAPGMLPAVADALAVLGMDLENLKNYEAARTCYLEALGIRRGAVPPNERGIANILNNLGTVQQNLRDYEGARKSHLEALCIRRKILRGDDVVLIAQSLNNLGLVQHDLGDYEGAKKSFEEALRIRQRILPANHPRIADILNNLGLVQHDLADCEGALKRHKEALAVYRDALPEDDPRIADSLNNRGLAQRDLGDLKGARESHEEALRLRRAALPADDPRVSQSLNNRGVVQHDLGDFKGALKSHEEALAAYRKALKADDARIANSLNNRGAAQVGLRDYAGARASHEQALAIFRKVLPKEHPDIAQSLNNLSQLDLASGRPTADTAAKLQEALTILQSHLLALAGSQAETEQLRAAAQARYTLSLFLSAVLTPGVRAEVPDVFDRAVRLKGLVTARQRWARDLRDASDPDTRRLLDELREVNTRLLRAAANRVAEARPGGELARLDADRKDLERRLAARSGAFRRYQKKAALGEASLRAALPPGVCLIDFLEYAHASPPPQGRAGLVYEQRLLAFVVRPGEEPVRVVELGPAGRMDTLVAAWRERYVARRPARAGEVDPGAELRKAVWDKVEKHLGKAEVVLVSPDGPLNFLPLAALPGGKPGTFLVHEYAFAVVPAPVLLPDLLARKPARLERPSLLLVGGVDFGKAADGRAGPGNAPSVPATWRDLPGTDREANDLRVRFTEAFPKAPAPIVLKKKEATKAAFVRAASGHPYVHLATHGFFADDAEASALDARRVSERLRLDRAVSGRHPGVLSGVLFAGINQPPDGALETCLLTALEVSELDLRGAELVTLSACQTGQGRTAGGEGVVGLQRAFQVGGARSVAASLWSASDAATQDLMSEFYKRLWAKDPVGKAEALRRAQLWMIGEWKGHRGGTEPEEAGGPLPPYFWAAFTLAGDWR
jgi:CHAT domain-containing protein